MSDQASYFSLTSLTGSRSSTSKSTIPAHNNSSLGSNSTTESSTNNASTSASNDRSADDFTVRVLTLNCWGLWLGAKKRRQRMEAIVKYLIENNCDIVFLQEVWVTSDFEIIRDGTEGIYRFAHLFRAGSVLGSSGIVILCKWIPKVVHFEPYSLNGSPFYPWHGDWFAGKGIAYSRVDFDGISLHLFSTHTHAYYKENEPIHDQYSIHRICQSYQLARFINFISDTACNRKADGKDLLIVAGDMNSTSSELPYKILTTMANLTDCFKTSRNNVANNNNIIHKHKLLAIKQKVYISNNDNISSNSNSSNNSQGEGVNWRKSGDNHLLDTFAEVLFDSDTEDEDKTYGHPRNSFTPGCSAIEDKASNYKKSSSKRIDFILCRLLTHGHCVVDRIPKQSKDPSSNCSLSDHEPVMVELKVSESSGSIEIENQEKLDVQVMEKTQNVLMQYYKYNRNSRTQLFYVVIFMFMLTLPSATYYALSNEFMPISTIVFMWLAASFLFAIGLLVGFLSYRFEQGAIEAIVNDITCKISVAKDHSDNGKSYYEYR